MRHWRFKLALRSVCRMHVLVTFGSLALTGVQAEHWMLQVFVAASRGVLVHQSRVWRARSILSIGPRPGRASSNAKVFLRLKGGATESQWIVLLVLERMQFGSIEQLRTLVDHGLRNNQYIFFGLSFSSFRHFDFDFLDSIIVGRRYDSIQKAAWQSIELRLVLHLHRRVRPKRFYWIQSHALQLSVAHLDSRVAWNEVDVCPRNLAHTFTLRFFLYFDTLRWVSWACECACNLRFRSRLVGKLVLDDLDAIVFEIGRIVVLVQLMGWNINDSFWVAGSSLRWARSFTRPTLFFASS